MVSRDPLEEEFRDFVAARSGALLRTAYLLSGDWATAEDLLQTALTKTYLAWKRLGGIEAIEPYARRVMINTSTSWWRRRWHGERPTDVLPERAGIDEIEQQLDRDLLWRHLSALPSRQRAVLVLRFYEDMSEAQTAALLGISPGTVKSQTSRALGTLRRRMGAEAVLDLPAGADPTPGLPRADGTDRPTPARNGADRPAPAQGGTDRPAPVRGGASVRPSTAYGAPTMVVGEDAAAVVAATNAPSPLVAPATAGRPDGTTAAPGRSAGVTAPGRPGGVTAAPGGAATGLPAQTAAVAPAPDAGRATSAAELTEEPAGDPVPVASGARAGAGTASRTARDEQRGRQAALPVVPAGSGEHR
ncbi:SigE family RNA polymerase sigma factor [Micromonospora sp. DSM 115977]|uniref:SigE family RNA polymerase sigma factor n=1 Tax=Micromonospora reichwaldensis TaxID=3075516 RepID=A0ABU2WSW6_9ACTN|nr:SigE family RNA polymerase sigma factor [Micromonospora sp. DSM 115977]MDT0528364.1 SigE family RNA polymerase sigma factor [Micromonospora sp. DSM 115977]